jgi:hypothetical protein
MVRGHTPNRRFAKTGLSSVHFGEEDEEKGDDESSDLQEVRLVAICVVSSSTLLIDVVGWLVGCCVQMRRMQEERIGQYFRSVDKSKKWVRPLS